MSTLIENVYMAKLAVLISAPKKYMIHCADSASIDKDRITWFDSDELELGATVWKDAEQGLVLSCKRTPRSRASCSKVMGMKDPIPQMTKT